jgi:polyhydroxyalkanoate synthesis regulator phasin
MEYIKVKNQPSLVRDPHTNSIINTNMAEYNEYVARRKSKSSETQRVENLESDVSEIKDDLNEIKSLLKMLVKGSD